MVLGTGPAGLTAALYAQRLGLSTIVFGDTPGGNVYMIANLMNYPGFIDGITGTQFGLSAFKQAQNEGAIFPMTRLDLFGRKEGMFSGVDTDGKTYTAPAAIVATGRAPKSLPVSNARMKGIHFCSICDGPLYRGQNATLAVIGGDNAAGQHALSLSRIAARVMLISRSDRLGMDAAHKTLIDRHENIEVKLRTNVLALKGQDVIEALTVESETVGITEIPVDGVFLAMGWQPNTKVLDFHVEKTPEGYLVTDNRLMTSIVGLFAAGDVRDTDMWQVLAACADGARAAKYAAEFLER